MFSPLCQPRRPWCVPLGMSPCLSWSFQEHRIMSLYSIRMLHSPFLLKVPERQGSKSCRHWGRSRRSVPGRALTSLTFLCPLALCRFSNAFSYYGLVLLTTELFQAGDVCSSEYRFPPPSPQPHPTSSHTQSPARSWHNFQVPKTPGNSVMPKLACAPPVRAPALKLAECTDKQRHL